MQKLYYSISEISEIVNEEQHILRYWEKEFDILKPKKNRAGNRIYSEKDLLIIKSIKKFLREDKLSLKGAKEQLSKLFDNNQDNIIFSNFDNQSPSLNLQADNNKEILKSFIDFLHNLNNQINKQR